MSLTQPNYDRDCISRGLDSVLLFTNALKSSANNITNFKNVLLACRFSVSRSIKHASRVISKHARVALFSWDDMQMKVRYRLSCEFFLIPYAIKSFCFVCSSKRIHYAICGFENCQSF